MFVKGFHSFLFSFSFLFFLFFPCCLCISFFIILLFLIKVAMKLLVQRTQSNFLVIDIFRIQQMEIFVNSSTHLITTSEKQSQKNLIELQLRFRKNSKIFARVMPSKFCQIPTRRGIRQTKAYLRLLRDSLLSQKIFRMTTVAVKIMSSGKCHTLIKAKVKTNTIF